MTFRLPGLLVASFLIACGGAPQAAMTPSEPPVGAAQHPVTVSGGGSDPVAFSPHCFENLRLSDDSGCGVTRAHCRKIATVRPAAYAAAGVPFQAGVCELVPQPWCFWHKGTNPDIHHKECFRTPSACERAFRLSASIPLTECAQERLQDPAKSYRFR